MNGSGPAADDEHGPNGFDLHALSGNLCRCTGYRPIRDAAYALGQPEAADPFAGPAWPSPPRRAAATMTSSAQGRYVRPADLAGRWSCSPPTRTRGWWPDPPTGASS